MAREKEVIMNGLYQDEERDTLNGNSEYDEESDLVYIEDFLTEKNYVKSFPNFEEITLPDRPNKGKKGSPEYNANEGRRKRVAMYRKFARLAPDEPITEDTIDEYVLIKVCTFHGCSREQLTKELLRQLYTGLERYDED